MLTPLIAYEPIDLPVIEKAPAVGFAFPQGKFAPLSESDLKTTCKTITMKWQVIGRAIEALLRPGMPEPSLADIGSIYVEATKYVNVANLIHTATKADLVPRQAGQVSVDIFAVGSEIAQFANEVLPPHAIPNEETISVSYDPDLDTAIASYLALWLMTRFRCQCISHAVINSIRDQPTAIRLIARSVAGCHFTLPTAYVSIVERLADGMTNTELIAASLVTKGVNLSFANELIGWSTQAERQEQFSEAAFSPQ